MRLPKLLIHAKKDKLYNSAYLLRALDRSEKEKHVFQGEDGKEFTLYIPTESINNQTVAYPTTGVVVAAYGENPSFKEGDVVVVEQNVIRTPERKFREWNVFWTTEDGEDLFKSFAIDTFCKINEDGTLTPREGVLICKNVYRENYSTALDLQLPDSAKSKRRDLVQVHTTWDSDECNYKVGDYLLIHRAADWRFKLKNEEYIVIDHYFEDVIAVVDSPDWSQPKIDNTIY